MASKVNLPKKAEQKLQLKDKNHETETDLINGKSSPEVGETSVQAA